MVCMITNTFAEDKIQCEDHLDVPSNFTCQEHMSVSCSISRYCENRDRHTECSCVDQNEDKDKEKACKDSCDNFILDLYTKIKS